MDQALLCRFRSCWVYRYSWKKDVLVDRSHRSLAPRGPDGKPRAIVAKLHYFQNCVEVLRRARSRPRWDLTGNQSPFFQTILQALPRPGLSSWRFGNCCAIARVSDSVFYFQPDCASLMMVKKNNSLMQMKRWGMSRRTSYLQRLESDCETKMCIAYIVYYICLPRCANILYFDAAKFSIKQFHWYILLFLLSDNGKNMKKWLKRDPLRLHN